MRTEMASCEWRRPHNAMCSNAARHVVTDPEGRQVSVCGTHRRKAANTAQWQTD